MQNNLDKKDISFEFCDYSNEYHCAKFAELINHYMTDPMGGSKPLTPLEQLRLVDGMANHPSGFVLFAIIDDQIVGLTTCFINFSTFKVKKYLNIHDVIVQKESLEAAIKHFRKYLLLSPDAFNKTELEENIRLFEAYIKEIDQYLKKNNYTQ